ncbi:hypothetical protein [Methylovulum psychrotolerans]|uniref:Uncharacterized protein n=1 Tax=Methylovulum psychrotolerans TaxID=1704499 RepID=A0A1Z4C1A0_9GAMM|nr:hypothetical protein [Methylovulum psychrotolerans]ASF47269.1 hypothetical protein CEK71_14990 [Methylovulum psychrotolerans]
MDSCPECNALTAWTADRCFVCHSDLGAPNRRLVNQQHEREALEQRYQAAVAEAEQRGVKQALAAFEASITNDSRAIINTSAYFLYGLLDSENQLYANYRQQTASATRKVAELINDRQRCSTESELFGTLAPELLYGALTLDNKGLVSYGKCAMILKDITVRRKATVLEENSYDFVKRHDIRAFDPLPVGYWTDWPNRAQLAVAKLATRIQSDTKDFASVLLFSNGDRAQDQFIEIHIYGSLDRQAIAEVALPTKKNWESLEFLDRALLEKIEAQAKCYDITCSNYD